MTFRVALDMYSVVKEYILNRILAVENLNQVSVVANKQTNQCLQGTMGDWLKTPHPGTLRF